MMAFAVLPLAFTLSMVFVDLVASSGPPHIIFILADDLGWNDVGFHGLDQIPTPNIDALAYSGIILKNYYTVQLCTPSRSAIMTGKHPIHTGMQHNVLYGCERGGLPLSEKILPQYLKELGYRTRIVGKWHLGFYKKEYTPTFRGFESHLGYWTGHQDYFDHSAEEMVRKNEKMWGLDMRRDLEPAWDLHGKYSTDVFTAEAVDIIHNHSTDEPLFLYLAHAATHSANPYEPLQAPDHYLNIHRHIEDFKRSKFAAILHKLDESVGKVVEALEQRRMLSNSIIVFVSDNGGAAAGFNLNAASNWPLRGVKNTLWEGGVRGAGLIWSPLLESRGIVAEQYVHVSDWLPTLLSAAKQNSFLNRTNSEKSTHENRIPRNENCIPRYGNCTDEKITSKSDIPNYVNSTVENIIPRYENSILRYENGTHEYNSPRIENSNTRYENGTHEYNPKNENSNPRYENSTHEYNPKYENRYENGTHEYNGPKNENSNPRYENGTHEYNIPRLENSINGNGTSENRSNDNSYQNEIDGIDVWSVLSRNEPSKRNTILHNIDDEWQISALTKGKWKLVKGHTYNGQWDGWYGPSGRHGIDDNKTSPYDTHLVINSLAGKAVQNLGFTLDPSAMRKLRDAASIQCGPVKEVPCEPQIAPCLFDIKNDPCEKNNLADRYPDVLSQMEKELANINRTAVAPINKPFDKGGDPKNFDHAWSIFGDDLK
ncbi:uncharacterized protein LOC103513493 isoform X2 [Diaphorina citri]|uniref:Uncharacterized protein LOC103513493 isoform X1 n=2 Tax=Diaphorina citri TaxID=121845 RepID=A0A3Q0J6Y2_DIACI|nr:uncharacterized protein LOC103513493 isoform X1 [Diaphorina citri]XP_026682471.1 uncharacterized protein LOC103513493 isoform X2 [Diaphorina citri]